MTGDLLSRVSESNLHPLIGLPLLLAACLADRVGGALQAAALYVIYPVKGIKR